MQVYDSIKKIGSRIGSGAVIGGLLFAYVPLAEAVFHEFKNPTQNQQKIVQVYDNFEEQQQLPSDLGDSTLEAQEKKDEQEKKGRMLDIANNKAIVENSPPPPEKVAQNLHELQEKYISIDKQMRDLASEETAFKAEIAKETYKADDMYSDYAEAKNLDKRVAELRSSGRDNNSYFKSLEQSQKQAHSYFKNKHHIEVSQAPQEIERLKQTVKTLEEQQPRPQIEPLKESMQNVKIEYHVRKTVAKTRPDYQQIKDRLTQLEKMHRGDDASKDRLNRLTTEERQKVLNCLTPEEAQKFKEKSEPRFHD